MMKKHIVCFGDSNTHGYCAEPWDCADGGDRFNEAERWTCLLAKHLGEDYLVLEEGLGGRTTVFQDPLTEGLCGIDMIFPVLMSHEPVDLLILMLGTNDSKSHNWTTPDTFRRDFEALIANYLELNPDLQVVLCTCCAVFENDYDIQESRVSISNNLIRTVAEEHGYPLADIHTLTLEHPQWFPDGVHPSNEGAAAIARAVADVLLAK